MSCAPTYPCVFAGGPSGESFWCRPSYNLQPEEEKYEVKQKKFVGEVNTFLYYAEISYCSLQWNPQNVRWLYVNTSGSYSWGQKYHVNVGSILKGYRAARVIHVSCTIENSKMCTSLSFTLRSHAMYFFLGTETWIPGWSEVRWSQWPNMLTTTTNPSVKELLIQVKFHVSTEICHAPSRQKYICDRVCIVEMILVYIHSFRTAEIRIHVHIALLTGNGLT